MEQSTWKTPEISTFCPLPADRSQVPFSLVLSAPKFSKETHLGSEPAQPSPEWPSGHLQQPVELGSWRGQWERGACPDWGRGLLLMKNLLKLDQHTTKRVKRPDRKPPDDQNPEGTENYRLSGEDGNPIGRRGTQLETSTRGTHVPAARAGAGPHQHQTASQSHSESPAPQPGELKSHRPVMSLRPGPSTSGPPRPATSWDVVS